MHQQRPTWQCDRDIPSLLLAAHQVEEEIVAQLEAADWAAKDVFAVRLALEEALLNAIKHGNRQDPEKRVRVACQVWPERVRICIADEGDGFDPASLPDPTDPDRLDIPSGRGILLMRSFMSRVDYNAKGNQLVMEKARGLEDISAAPCQETTTFPPYSVESCNW